MCFVYLRRAHGRHPFSPFLAGLDALIQLLCHQHHSAAGVRPPRPYNVTGSSQHHQWSFCFYIFYQTKLAAFSIGIPEAMHLAEMNYFTNLTNKHVLGNANPGSIKQAWAFSGSHES